MAIDYLIGALIAASVLVNALALGAFWVTPGLRTTANRFVINLLIVNLVGCAALTPSLLCSSSSSQFQPDSSHSRDRAPVNRSADLALALATDVEAVERAVDLVSEATAAGMVTAMEVVASIAADEAEQQQSKQQLTVGQSAEWDAEESLEIGGQQDAAIQKTAIFWGNTRHWGLDLTAALGALSVLLIVGDTWCAVTDPLRYHARISTPKAWIAIAVSWLLSAAFGAASAFRSNLYYAEVPGEQDDASSDLSDDSTDPTSVRWLLYDTVYASTYFLLIILLPSGLVCGMYWKIVTEAKQNGLRMRQNGSSPLLQSALNLAQSTVAPGSATNTTASSLASSTNGSRPQSFNSAGNPAGGLVMNIDLMERGGCDEEDDERPSNVQPLLTAPAPVSSSGKRYLEIPGTLNASTATGATKNADKNHNSLLAVPTIGGNLSRNLSSRHLMLTIEPKTHEQAHQPATNEPSSPVRHVRSTPNLQKTDAQHAVAMHTLHHHPHLQNTHSVHHHHHSNHHQHQFHPSAGHVPCRAFCYMTSIRHRLSNASSIFKYRDESRAARISVLVVIMILCSYFPYGILVLLEGVHVRWPQLPNAQLIAIVCCMAANIGSPVIFAYRNKRVRRGVCRLFGLDAKTRERLQKRQLSMPSSSAGNHHHQQQPRPASAPAAVAVRLSTASTTTTTSTLMAPALVTVSINGKPEATSQRRRADDQTLTDGLKLKLSLLKRVYHTTRRLSCTASTCSGGSASGSEESSASAAPSVSSGSSGHSHGIEISNNQGRSSSCCTLATDGRRQSSDV